MTIAPNQSPSATRRRGLGMVELLAVLFLTLGSVLLPVLGWLIGVVLLTVSKAWSRTDKLIATFVFPGGLLAAVLLWSGAIGGYSCTSSTFGVAAGPARTVESYCDPHPPAYVGLALFIVLVAGPLLVNVMLVRVALRKR